MRRARAETSLNFERFASRNVAMRKNVFKFKWAFDVWISAREWIHNINYYYWTLLTLLLFTVLRPWRHYSILFLVQAIFIIGKRHLNSKLAMGECFLLLHNARVILTGVRWSKCERDFQISLLCLSIPLAKRVK